MVFVFDFVTNQATLAESPLVQRNLWSLFRKHNYGLMIGTLTTGKNNKDSLKEIE
jgi:hypothetical protein